MPPNPDDWLKESLSARFHKDFINASEVLQIKLPYNLYGELKLITDDYEHGLDIDMTLKVILFRYLYGIPACRYMKQQTDGLFRPHLVLTTRTNRQRDEGAIELSLPKRMLDDVLTLNLRAAKAESLPDFIALIFRRYALGFRQELNRPELLTNFQDNEKKDNLHFSLPLYDHLMEEVEMADTNGNQFLRDLLADYAYGYIWRKNFAESGLNRNFSPPQLIPVCNTRNPLREHWGLLKKNVTIFIPEPLHDDLTRIIRNHHAGFSAYLGHTLFGESVRNILHSYVLGHLFMSSL